MSQLGCRYPNHIRKVMKMTNKEAIKLLDPSTTVEALAEIEYYNGFSGREACIKAIEDACVLAVEDLEKQKWNKTSDVKPTKENQYLCCSIYSGRPYFKVSWWSNDLYEVSRFDFFNCKGECGFYEYDSECGYLESFCDYWQEIDWSDEDGK